MRVRYVLAIGSEEGVGVVPPASRCQGRGITAARVVLSIRGEIVVKLSVIGCGYLGAVHAASMAELGHEVVGVDVDSHRISELSARRAPFYEPRLLEILESAGSAGRLSFSTDVAALAGAQVHFLAVGTPQRANGNAADLSYVDAAIDSLIPHLGAGDLVVGKSTVPVGTAERLAARVVEGAPGAVLAWNPEFLREGFAVADTMNPDRIVYGLPSASRFHEGGV